MTNVELFEGWFKLWQQELGLTDWKLVYTKEDKSLPGYASIKYDYAARHFWLYCNLEGCGDIKLVAFHEVMHLMLADLCIDNDKKEHQIIYRLENFIDKHKICTDCKTLINQLK